LTGKAHVNKEIFFVRHIREPITMRPDTALNHISEHEKRCSETITLQILNFGKSFPEPAPAGINIFGATIDRFDFISKLGDSDELGLNKSTVTVIADLPVSCLRIKRVDFAHFMKWDNLILLQKKGYLYNTQV
jgi:hypothetical protein